ncbi:MAG: LamG domain-containing protein [Candidatus Micrarchaeota archaeon]
MNTFRKSFIKKKPFPKASAKAQSAMEYLMTYGWAILIISVVLAALFQLGVFNPMTFAPKAPPGSCQVFRPDGPGTTSFINLEGVCSGELPQYVAEFNGHSSYISIPYNPLLIPSNKITVVAWIKVTGPIVDYPTIITATNYAYTLQECEPGGVNGASITFWINGNGDGNTCSSIANVEYNQWYFTALTYNGTTANQYQNGVLVYSQSFSTTMSSTSPIYIGVYPNYGSGLNGGWNGSIANVQIYNTSLSANEIQALYLEGIGGAPIDLQNLVAWWPLNGNANDYSGNGNNGQISNVNFVSNWYNGYTPP